MCGVAGIYGPSLPGAAGETTLHAMLRLIRHRGPNEAGMYLSDRLCMGTVRLSIIDIESGQQPVCDDEERYCLCYNGEIYNYIELRRELAALGHRFATQSDTEVVLHAWRAWGARCLRRFNGAFAFALYDSREDALYLARDRYGKRPLFYARHGADVVFASEMKSFLAIEDFRFEFDAAQLASILTFWTPVAGQSGFKGIQQVPQGSYLVVDGSGVSMQRYYELDFAAPCEVRSEADAIAAVGSALRKAVQLRLRSDVEVGMYLSGGLDSSILAGLLAEQASGGFRTYSVTFDDAEFDESADQQRMVAHVNSRHKALHVTGDMIARHFPAAVFHAEVPVFRTALVPMYLLSRMVRDDGIKVVLTGEGADEAFLGYDLFKETLLRRDWNVIPEGEKLERLRRLYPYLKHYGAPNEAALLGLYQQFSTERYPGLFSHELRIQNGRRENGSPRTGELIRRYCEPGAELVPAFSWSEQTGKAGTDGLDGVKQLKQDLTRQFGALPEYIEKRLAAMSFLAASQLRFVTQPGIGLEFAVSHGKGRGNRLAAARYYDHHRTHAATACFTSPFDEAACAVIDGFGEDRAFNCYAYRDGKLAELEIPAGGKGSLGFFYIDVCEACGFSSFGGEEWKVMGLAPYGRLDEEIYGLLKGMISVNGLSIEAPTGFKSQKLQHKLNQLSAGRTSRPSRRRISPLPAKRCSRKS